MIMLVLARVAHDLRLTALYLYVKNVDAMYKTAMDAGGVSLSLSEDQFYGDRCAGVQDTEGNNWWIASRIEDLTSDEIGERIASQS